MLETRPLVMASVMQVPTALVLAVTYAELPFRAHVLSSRHVVCGDVSLHFSIIGESHFVRVERCGQLWFHELLACAPLQAFTEGHIHAFDELIAHDYTKDNYHTKITFSQSQPRPCLNTRSSITVRFPRQHDVIPLTHIAWDIHPDRIDWWTLHTYPEATHTTFVLSESSLNTLDNVPR